MDWNNNSIVIYSNFLFHLEDWSPLSLNKGIGGSEEAIIYLSQELLKLGYQVTVFNRCGDMEGEYDGVVYQSVDKFNPQDNFNVLIYHRAWLQPMQMKINARKTAIWMHDNPQLFPAVEESQRSDFLSSFDKIFMLSKFHKSLLPDWIPEDKIFLTTNGINLEDFNLQGITRNPTRLISISDYTRGIENLLEQWDRVLKAVPDVELHIYYGWQGVDALINSPYIDRFPQLPDKKKRLLQLFEQKNVFEHGRIGHKQLVEELFKSGIWVYPCHTDIEIFCISAWKAQAAGCVPVVTSHAGLNETVQSGIRIQGSASNEQTNNALIEGLIDLLINPDKQESLRQEALALKDSFGWDKVAQQWHQEFIAV